MVDHVLLDAVAAEWALILVVSPAVACLCCCGVLVSVYDLLVVRLECCFDIFGAAVGDFNCASVENFVEGVRLGKMFIQELQELCAYVGGDSAVVWGVEPYDVS